MNRISERHSSQGPTAANCERAMVLSRSRGSRIPRLSEAQIVTIPDVGRVLLSQSELDGHRILIKRLAPSFDRTFVQCRILLPASTPGEESESQQPFYCYGIQFVGVGKNHPLTRMLYRELVLDRPTPARPLREPQRPAKRCQESLMPLLSAIGLAVVYACNLTF